MGYISEIKFGPKLNLLLEGEGAADSSTSSIVDGGHWGQLDKSFDKYDKVIGPVSYKSKIRKVYITSEYKNAISWAIDQVSKLSNHFLDPYISKLERIFTFQVKTMSTDGKHLFINPGFMDEIMSAKTDPDDPESDAIGLPAVVFLLIHEIYHNVFQHHQEHYQLKDKYPDFKKANYAMDYQINWVIEHSFPDMRGSSEYDPEDPSSSPFILNADGSESTVRHQMFDGITECLDGCINPEYAGKLWTEIYKLLSDKDMAKKPSTDTPPPPRDPDYEDGYRDGWNDMMEKLRADGLVESVRISPEMHDVYKALFEAQDPNRAGTTYDDGYAAGKAAALETLKQIMQGGTVKSGGGKKDDYDHQIKGLQRMKATKPGEFDVADDDDDDDDGMQHADNTPVDLDLDNAKGKGSGGQQDDQDNDGEDQDDSNQNGGQQGGSQNQQGQQGGSQQNGSQQGQQGGSQQNGSQQGGSQNQQGGQQGDEEGENGQGGSQNQQGQQGGSQQNGSQQGGSQQGGEQGDEGQGGSQQGGSQNQQGQGEQQHGENGENGQGGSQSADGADDGSDWGSREGDNPDDWSDKRNGMTPEEIQKLLDEYSDELDQELSDNGYGVADGDYAGDEDTFEGDAENHTMTREEGEKIADRAGHGKDKKESEGVVDSDTVTDEENDEIIEKIIEQVEKYGEGYASSGVGGKGGTKRGLTRMLNHLRQLQTVNIDWKGELYDLLENREYRRVVNKNSLLPGNEYVRFRKNSFKSHAGAEKFLVFLDTSGSVCSSKGLAEMFVGMTKSILTDVDIDTIDMWKFSDDSYGLAKTGYDGADEPLVITDGDFEYDEDLEAFVNSVENGGTNYASIFERIKESYDDLGEMYDGIIIYTDEDLKWFASNYDKYYREMLTSNPEDFNNGDGKGIDMESLQDKVIWICIRGCDPKNKDVFRATDQLSNNLPFGEIINVSKSDFEKDLNGHHLGEGFIENDADEVDESINTKNNKTRNMRKRETLSEAFNGRGFNIPAKKIDAAKKAEDALVSTIAQDIEQAAAEAEPAASGETLSGGQEEAPQTAPAAAPAAARKDKRTDRELKDIFDIFDKNLASVEKKRSSFKTYLDSLKSLGSEKFNDFKRNFVAVLNGNMYVADAIMTIYNLSLDKIDKNQSVVYDSRNGNLKFGGLMVENDFTLSIGGGDMVLSSDDDIDSWNAMVPAIKKVWDDLIDRVNAEEAKKIGENNGIFVPYENDIDVYVKTLYGNLTIRNARRAETLPVGLPKVVRGSIEISNMPNLRSLEGLPKTEGRVHVDAHTCPRIKFRYANNTPDNVIIESRIALGRKFNRLNEDFDSTILSKIVAADPKNSRAIKQIDANLPINWAAISDSDIKVISLGELEDQKAIIDKWNNIIKSRRVKNSDWGLLLYVNDDGKIIVAESGDNKAAGSAGRDAYARGDDWVNERTTILYLDPTVRDILSERVKEVPIARDAMERAYTKWYDEYKIEKPASVINNDPYEPFGDGWVQKKQYCYGDLSQDAEHNVQAHKGFGIHAGYNVDFMSKYTPLSDEEIKAINDMAKAKISYWDSGVSDDDRISGKNFVTSEFRGIEKYTGFVIRELELILDQVDQIINISGVNRQDEDRTKSFSERNPNNADAEDSETFSSRSKAFFGGKRDVNGRFGVMSDDEMDAIAKEKKGVMNNINMDDAHMKAMKKHVLKLAMDALPWLADMDKDTVSAIADDILANKGRAINAVDGLSAKEADEASAYANGELDRGGKTYDLAKDYKLAFRRVRAQFAGNDPTFKSHFKGGNPGHFGVFGSAKEREQIQDIRRYGRAGSVPTESELELPSYKGDKAAGILRTQEPLKYLGDMVESITIRRDSITGNSDNGTEGTKFEAAVDELNNNGKSNLVSSLTNFNLKMRYAAEDFLHDVAACKKKLVNAYYAEYKDKGAAYKERATDLIYYLQQSKLPIASELLQGASFSGNPRRNGGAQITGIGDALGLLIAKLAYGDETITLENIAMAPVNIAMISGDQSKGDILKISPAEIKKLKDEAIEVGQGIFKTAWEEEYYDPASKSRQTRDAAQHQDYFIRSADGVLVGPDGKELRSLYRKIGKNRVYVGDYSEPLFLDGITYLKASGKFVRNANNDKVIDPDCECMKNLKELVDAIEADGAMDTPIPSARSGKDVVKDDTTTLEKLFWKSVGMYPDFDRSRRKKDDAPFDENTETYIYDVVEEYDNLQRWFTTYDTLISDAANLSGQDVKELSNITKDIDKLFN